jgi:hypothetical protein
MGWFDVIKWADFYTSDSAKERILDQNLTWQSASEKGYPKELNDARYIVETDRETQDILGYTTIKDFGKFYFVGNGFTYEEGKGVWKKLLAHRNKHYDDKPKITLLNPIPPTTVDDLIPMVKKLGGVKVLNYDSVSDIMDESRYKVWSKFPMYRYGFRGEEE